MSDTSERRLHRNPHLAAFDHDFLYHFGLDSKMDLPTIFAGVKYVCMGGSGERAEHFALKAAEQLGIQLPPEGLQPIGKTERYSLYKVGPIISVSHGMGMPSASIAINELTKLIEYAQLEGVKFIRIGTSGGLGVNLGDVVVTEEAVNGELDSVYEAIILGERKRYATTLDAELVEALVVTAGEIPTVVGKTMSTDGFYEEQARMDGALEPAYTKEEVNVFFREAYQHGVRNIEMEAGLIASFCLRAGIPAAVVCAAIVTRLDGDQIVSTPEQLAEFSDRAQQVVLNYILNQETNAG